MNYYARCLVLLVLAVGVEGTARAESATPDIHKAVNEVQLEIIATDSAGLPVANLSPSDLKVFEDGKPVRQFGLSRAHDLPLFAMVVYDTSESNQKAWREMREPVETFIRQTIQKQDQLWVAAFDRDLHFKMQVHDSSELLQALSACAGPQNVTAFNDALLHALRDQSSGNIEPRRAAMILFSDGEDNYSLHSLPEVIASAQRAKIAIYSVRRRQKHDRGDGDAALRAVATGTGGRNFIVSNTRDLQQALETITNELRSCYVLYYPTPLSRSGNEFRRVHISPARNHQIRIQVQNGYYVPVDSAAAGE